MEKGEAGTGVRLGTEHKHRVLTCGRRHAWAGHRALLLDFMEVEAASEPGARGSVLRVVAWAAGALGHGNL